MTSITLPRFNSQEGLSYYQSGEGIPLLLIHGVGLRVESWYQQIAALEDNYSVFAVDMPGHGYSDLLTEVTPTLYNFTEKLAKFIIEVVKQPVVIVGHSMGALLSLSLAKEYPELCLAIVPMNTIYKRSEEAKKAVRERACKLQLISREDACAPIFAPISRWFGGSLSTQDEFHAQLCRDWLLMANLAGYAVAYKIFSEEDGPATSTIRHLSMPVLYLTGALDLNSNISMTQAMASVTPNAEYFIVEDSRHMTPLTHASVVNTVVNNFLQRRLASADICDLS